MTNYCNGCIFQKEDYCSFWDAKCIDCIVPLSVPPNLRCYTSEQSMGEDRDD